MKRNLENLTITLKQISFVDRFRAIKRPRRSLQDNKATGMKESILYGNSSGLSALLVAPVGIEPTSSESESEILSIEIRSQKSWAKIRILSNIGLANRM